MRRYLIILAALLLLALAGVASLSTVRAPAPPAITHDAGTVPGATQPERASEPRNKLVTLPIHDDAPQEAEPVEEPWTLCGRVEMAPYQGIHPWLAMSESERMVEISWLSFSDATGALDRVEADPDRDGRFSVEWPEYEADPVDIGFFVAPHADMRSANPLTEIVRQEFRPARETVKGLSIPRIEGKRIDFGVIRVDLAANAQPPWLLKGRLVHASGVPLMQQGSHWITIENSGPAADWLWYPEAGPDGHFLEFVSAYWMIDKQQQWRLGAEHFGRERFTPMSAPRIVDKLADFGDVVVPGALMDVRVELNGAWSTAPVRLTLDKIESAMSSSRTFDSYNIAGARTLALPSGQYEWRAELVDATLLARPLKGKLTLGEDRPLLALAFTSARSIPVRVLDPKGKDVTYAMQYLVAPLQGEGRDDWSARRKTGRHRVPVEPGSVTNVHVWSSLLIDQTWHYRVAGLGQARFGDTELVIQLAVPVPGPFQLEVVVPRAPPELVALQREAVVALALGDDVEELLDWQPVELSADSEVIRVFHVKDARQVEVWLEGGELIGYLDGRMTAGATVTIPKDGRARVTLPAIALPPWKVRAQGLTSVVTCGGHDAVLTGSFGGYRRAATATFFPNGQIDFERSSRKRGIRLPGCLLENGRTIPLQVDAPGRGNAFLRIELPARVIVTLSIAGQDITDFEVVLDTGGEVPTVCKAWPERGVARLWAPPGRAELRVHANGESVALADSERWVHVPAEGSIEIKLGGLSRVEFARPEGSEDAESATWTMFALDRGVDPDISLTVKWGDAKQVPEGRYRLVPLLPYDPSAAFDVEIKGSKLVTLPVLVAPELVSVLLRLPFAMEDLRGSGEFEYFMAIAGDAAISWSFMGTGSTPRTKMSAEGIEILGLPAGRKIVLRGRIDSNINDKYETRLLRPIVFDPRERRVLDAVLDPAVSDGNLYIGDATIAVLSDLTDHALPWTFDRWLLRTGRQEIAVFSPAGEQVFRMWINVPHVEESLELEHLPDLKARLIQHRMIEDD